MDAGRAFLGGNKAENELNWGAGGIRTPKL